MRRDRSLLLATLLCQAAMLVAYVPALFASPSALDDYGSLREFALAGPEAILGSDRFGHVRPLKNLLFWTASRLPEQGIWPLRTLVLLAQLALAAIVQRAVSRAFSPWLGLTMTLLWALHPATATAVSWLSAANLVTCLLGIVLYFSAGRGALAGSKNAPFAAWLSLVFAVLSHELALLAPLLALALPEVRRSRRHWLGTAALLLTYFALRLSTASALPSYRMASQPPLLLAFSSARYLLANVAAWLWPFGSFGVLDSDVPAQHLLASALAWPAVLGLGVALGKLAVRARPIAVGALWALAFYLPVVNLLPLGNTPLAPHYGYIPGLGLALLVAYALSRLGMWLPSQRRLAASALLGVGAVALLYESRGVVAAFADEELLYRTSHENHPDNVEVVANLSSLYLRQRRYEEARSVLDRALMLAPDDPIVFENTLDLQLATGKPEAALAALQARTDTAQRAPLLLRQGRALEQLGRPYEAADSYLAAFRGAPERTDDRFRAGFLAVVQLLRSDRGAAARELVRTLQAEYPGRDEVRLAAELLAPAPDR
jgi:Tfp pilus assembly protein PilF